jgi:3-dehydroquinate dehydratase type I
MPLICTPIKVRTQKEALSRWRALKGKADLAEIWIDEIRDLDLKNLLKNRPTPVLLKSTLSKNIPLLILGSKWGAEYLDIPDDFSPLLIKKCVQSKGRTKIILSFHDFKKTPSAKILHEKALKMHKLGADIVKIAVQGKTLEEVIRVIALAEDLKQANIKHILISMGKAGALSRVITPHLGGTLMFAPVNPKEKTAPGQLTVKELRSAWNLVKSSHT